VNPCPDNPRSAKILSQTNIVDNPVDKSPSKGLVADPVSEIVDALVVESLKETITHSNVAPDVVTSLAHSDAHIETTHDNPHKEFESESAYGNDNSQQKVVVDNE